MSGVAGADRRASGIEPSPPGTAADVDVDAAETAMGAGVGATAAGGATSGASPLALAAVAAPVATSTGPIGSASGTSRTGSAAPPADAVNETERTLGAAASPPGYAVSRPDTLVVGIPGASTTTPDPTTAISRQPMRDASKASSKVIAAPAPTGVGSGASNVHARRIVESPPLPAGKVRPASTRSSLGDEPPTASRRSRPTPTQPDRRAAVVSAADRAPSPSRSNA